MLSIHTLATAVVAISELTAAHRDYLVELDQVNGDGDLGISMDDGFRALAAFLEDEKEEDLGQALRGGAKVFNSSAPSSLGTILSFGLMGMAKSLRGTSEATLEQTAAAFAAGLENIMVKAESKPGEKTILDALAPAVDALNSHVSDGAKAAFDAAAVAAAEGSEATRQMTAVHGRAAYSASRSIGILDGGSVVGRLIFVGIAASLD
ncbi:Dak phosphatase [Dermabacter hominis 1368]|uniref:Dak phosphatase n=1 Tax=Dermabacter hominis 1368 TaxID=1450519 RepID=A0ABR4SJ98_9MICO|nr:Dak phosphatase [Dermabacter hominis 1368]